MKRKVLSLITNLGKGGAQRVFYDHSIFLKKRYQVNEAVFDSAEDTVVYESGLPLFSLDVKGGSTVYGKVRNLLKRAERLRELVEEKEFELVISHMDGANWVNVLSASQAKKILVVHGTILHDQAIEPFMGRLRLKWVIPRLYRKADCVVAVSKGIRKELETYCGLVNVIDIPNAFDIEGITAKAHEALSAAWEMVFQHETLITSGRLHDQKKQRHLLPVFSRLKTERPGLKLIIMGDGDLRDDLITEAEGMGLKVYSVWKNNDLSADYDLYFPGYLANPFQFLRKSSVFVFPSGWEGFPLALCEAMIAGVPVLASDCPTGPREIIAPGTFDLEYGLNDIERTSFGYLLPMTNKESFETTWLLAIKELLDNAEQRKEMAVNARARIREYDKAAVMEKWNQVIDGLLKKKKQEKPI